VGEVLQYNAVGDLVVHLLRKPIAHLVRKLGDLTEAKVLAGSEQERICWRWWGRVAEVRA
jgi:hypothetical protein